MVFVYIGHVLLYHKRTVASSVTVRLRGSGRFRVGCRFSFFHLLMTAYV